MYLLRNHVIDVLKIIEALFLGGKFQGRSSRKEEIFWVRACVVAPPSAPGPMIGWFDQSFYLKHLGYLFS
jgi:hypothetical protein